MADPIPPAPTPASSRSERLKQALIAAGLMLVVGVLFFFIGLIQGKKAVPALEGRAAAAEAQLADVRDRAQLNEALALTYRTTLDLDARNFGTANEHLHAAARALDGLSGADGNGVDDLRRQMAAADVTVAADLAQQRARVLEFAGRVEALLQNRPEAAAPAE